MNNPIAAALGLAFTLVVCFFAMQALLSPWLLRLRRRAAAARAHEKPAAGALPPRDASAAHLL